MAPLPTSATGDAAADEPFQPGQLGTRHLLGAMTVAAVVMGLCAARLRTLAPMEAGQVIAHWSFVAIVAAATFFVKARRLTSNRAAAGALRLRVQKRPMTDRRRWLLRWLLTGAVVLDGVFISVAAIPEARFMSLAQMLASHVTSVFYLLVGEAGLWVACLNHWLANVDWVEFREHGLLMHGRYYPWEHVTRIGWSPAHPQNLVFFYRGMFNEMMIDPASREAVSEVLERVQVGKATAG
jgi:hypothetical protein